MHRFITVASLCLLVCVLACFANQASQPDGKKGNQPKSPDAPKAPKDGKRDPGVLTVMELSNNRAKYLNKTVRVRGNARLVQEIVGLQKPGMIQTEIVCVFDRTEVEGVRARFNGDASGSTERTLTIEGEVFQLRSDFPGMQNAMMMRKCKLVK
jgi:hypothetical protein